MSKWKTDQFVKLKPISWFTSTYGSDFQNAHPCGISSEMRRLIEMQAICVITNPVDNVSSAYARATIGFNTTTVDTQVWRWRDDDFEPYIAEFTCKKKYSVTQTKVVTI